MTFCCLQSLAYIDNNNDNFGQVFPDLTELDNAELACPDPDLCTEESPPQDSLKRNTLYPPILPSHSLSCILNGYRKIKDSFV